MERKANQHRRRRWEVVLSILRNLFVIALLVGAYYGVKYVLQRSDEEVAELKNRPESTAYLSVEKPIQMSVINEDGQLAMKIEGSSVTLSKDQSTATFKDAKAEYFENGRASITFEAGTVEYNTNSEDFTIYGGRNGGDRFKLETSDGMSVLAPRVEWRRFKETGPNARKAPSFRFSEGVEVNSRDGNRLAAAYMQADRELQYMEFVGNVRGDVASLQDTRFITERELTDVGQLKLEDFEKLVIGAEQVIYDKRNQVVLATSRGYDRSFTIKDFDGQVVDVAKYQTQPQQVIFSKEEVSVSADHLEAHILRKWAECFGNIGVVIKPSQPKLYGEDKALATVRRNETRIEAGDIEYFWGKDCVISHSRTVLTQADRRGEADKLTYWGGMVGPEVEDDIYREKMVLLDGNIVMAQGSGNWLFSDDLVEVKDQDQSRLLQGYTEMFADRAVMYLNNNDFIASGAVWIRQDNREIAAETIVYQDEIKRLTAQDDVKFVDIDGQTFLCGSLVYHNKTKFMEVSGGTSATIRLPAKYANDINRAIAESRERPVPAAIEDPPIPDEPTRNPNLGRQIAMGARSETVQVPGVSGGLGLPPPPINDGGSVGPGFIPDVPDGESETGTPQELLLRFGDDGPPTPEEVDSEGSSDEDSEGGEQ